MTSLIVASVSLRIHFDHKISSAASNCSYRAKNLCNEFMFNIHGRPQNSFLGGENILWTRQNAISTLLIPKFLFKLAIL